MRNLLFPLLFVLIFSGCKHKLTAEDLHGDWIVLVNDENIDRMVASLDKVIEMFESEDYRTVNLANFPDSASFEDAMARSIDQVKMVKGSYLGMRAQPDLVDFIQMLSFQPDGTLYIFDTGKFREANLGTDAGIKQVAWTYVNDYQFLIETDTIPYTLEDETLSISFDEQTMVYNRR